MEDEPSGRSSARRSSAVSQVGKRRARGGPEGTRARLWEGQDVLARWSDGLLYLGKIRKVDRWKQICLVRFEDNSEFWELWKDIYPPALPGSEQVCCLCSDTTSSQHNPIVNCVKCKQGYHWECHAPPIEADGGAPSLWICRLCIFAVATKKGGALKKGPYAKAMQAMKRVLPYRLESLEWDSQHLTNQQQCYCYCGGPGEWNVKMLQCYRCQHWFHEACTQCLSKPLLHGDRFYLFLCCVCTGGSEYVKRLPLGWVDIAHLVLYHLTSCCRRKYFDFEREILAFANENWDNLLVGELSNATKAERYDQLLNTLNSHRERFVSGKEIKKKKCIFALQERLPPPPPPPASLREVARQLTVPLGSLSTPPTRWVRTRGAEETEDKETLRRRDPQDLYTLKTRKARRLLQKAITQNVVANPSSPSQAYQGSRGSTSAYPSRENTERTPPKMMFASIQPSSNAVRSLESSSSSSFEYGDTTGSQTRAAAGGGRLSDGEEAADPPETEQEEEEDEDEEGEEEEEDEECSDNPTDSRSQCDSSDEDLPLSYFCSSVNSYFGAMGRLARGETVRILARRLTLDNKVQYLVEWGGSSMF